MAVDIEQIVFENLLNNEEYFRTVIPFLQEDYFDSNVNKTIFKFVKLFSEKHNKPPNQKILQLLVKEWNKFSQQEFEEASQFVSTLNGKEENFDWVIERTEKFCQDKAVVNAIMKSITIIEGKDNQLNKEAIPSILQDALAISFDKSVGLDFLADIDHRWDFYHLKQKKVPFPIKILNKITNGGVSSKTLNVYLMGTNVGKSLTMCDHAAFCIRSGYKALYITAEMSEEEISKRIDCNLLDVTPEQLMFLSKEKYVGKLNDIKDVVKGNLVVKEYPTSAAHVGHFKALLEELKLKKKFVPDIIFIDYINICASQKLKMGGSVNSYQYIKSITEELRGLAVEYDVPIISATQTNKSSWSNSDIEMSDTSESGGLPMTVDLLLGAIRTEELDKLNQILFRQLKSRYGNVSKFRKFVVGVEIEKFKLFDIEESYQREYTEESSPADVPLYDKSKARTYEGIDFT